MAGGAATPSWRVDEEEEDEKDADFSSTTLH